MIAQLAEQNGLTRRALALSYAAVCYAIFLISFLLFIAFAAGVSPFSTGRGEPSWWAALADAGLVLGFGLQHSIMARTWFKRAWTRIVPEPVERATYVLAASLMLLSVILFWQPIPGALWDVSSTLGRTALWGIFGFGWALVLFTTFLIDHFELFGLRQAWTYAVGRPEQPASFKTPSAYRLVRHPMQLGFVIALWAAPTMTADRLALAVLMTVYIVTALVFEERDLVTLFGDQYRAYQKQVPKLIPNFRLHRG